MDRVLGFEPSDFGSSPKRAPESAEDASLYGVRQ